MSISHKMFIAVTVALVALGVPASAQEDVVVCWVTEVIDEGMAVVVERAVDEANAMGAKAIIFRVNTPGGRVDSAIQIASAIQRAEGRAIAFIEKMGAISAGALISFACDDIIMTPGTNMGAATPVIPSAEGMKPTGEKEVSFMRAKMRALAEANGFNPDVAQAMVDKDIELRGYEDEEGNLVIYAVTHEGAPDPAGSQLAPPPKSPIERILETQGIDLPSPPPPAAPAPVQERAEPGTVVYDDGSKRLLPKGKLLTLTPNEAMRYGVIPAIVEDFDAALEYYDLSEATLHEIVPNWAEEAFRWLTSPTIAGLLLLLGLGGLYLEMQAPGFGLPGIIGVSALIILVGSHYVLGLADTIDIVLILIGIGLLVVEVFVLPGFGIAGFGGIVCLTVGLYLSLVHFTIPQYSWEFERLSEVGFSLGLAIVLFGIFAVATWRYLPRTPFYGRLVMTGTQQVAEGYTVQGSEDVVAAIGREGVATSMLRPAGRGRFGKDTYQVVSHGDFIEEGTPIRIVEVEGNRYVVDPVPQETRA